MRIIVVLALNFCIALSGFSQTGQPFSLSGNVDTDTGTAFLLTVGNGLLYPTSLRNLQVPIINSQFKFNGEIANPQCLRILIRKGNETRYVSAFFTLDSGSQTVSCHIDSAHENVVIANRMSGDAARLDTWLIPYDSCIYNSDGQYDSLKAAGHGKIADRTLNDLTVGRAQCHDLRDSLLLSFVADNPRSWPAFWKLAVLFDNGYETRYAQILDKFDTTLKSTYSGKELASQLTSAKAMAKGSYFPSIPLEDLHSNKKTFGNNNLTAQYTLVDLWFSTCTPCRAQFVALKKLYVKTQRSKFSMVAISTDDNNHISEWKKAIQTDQLPWEQYRDVNKAIIDDYNITMFPTNFLLDKTGKIIRKDLSPSELAAFLSTN